MPLNLEMHQTSCISLERIFQALYNELKNIVVAIVPHPHMKD